MAKIVVFGANGGIGSRVVAEAANRGHAVVAVARDADSLVGLPEQVLAAQGDVTQPSSVADLTGDADVVVSAVGGPDTSVYARAAATFLEVHSAAGAKAPRVIHVGGSGSLLTNDGVRLVDTGVFPEFLRDEILGQAASLDVYRKSQGLTWTYISPPPGNFEPGPRRGVYRTGFDHPVVNDEGRFGLSYEDFAVAVIDEVEQKRFPNQRFTVGY